MPVKIGLLLLLVSGLACKSTNRSQSKILSTEVDSDRDGSKPANAISASPSSLLEISSCIEAAPEDFAMMAKEIDRLRTKKRPAENPNNCTGCSQTACTTCHASNEGGFFAPSLDTSWSATLKAIIQIDVSNTIAPFTFAKTYFQQHGSYYLPTNRIQLKAEATKSAPPYSHPNFIVSAEFNQAFNEFTASIAKKVNAELCRRP